MGELPVATSVGTHAHELGKSGISHLGGSPDQLSYFPVLIQGSNLT